MPSGSRALMSPPPVELVAVDRRGQRPQPARDARPRRLLGDAEARRDRRVAELVDDAQAHRLALLGAELGQRALDGRAQLAQGGELLDADLLLGLERRRLDAQAGQGPALGPPAAQRLVQDVAPDAEDPGRQRVAVGWVGREATALLEGARVGLGHQVDRQLRVVRAAREEDQQPASVVLVGGGEAIGVEALAGHPLRSCRLGPML